MASSIDSICKSNETDPISGQTYHDITAKFVQAFFELADVEQFRKFPTRQPFEKASKNIILDLLKSVSATLGISLGLLEAGSTAEYVPAVSTKHCEMLGVQDLSKMHFAIERDIMIVAKIDELLPETECYHVQQVSKGSCFVNIHVVREQGKTASLPDIQFYHADTYGNCESFYSAKRFHDTYFEALKSAIPDLPDQTFCSVHSLEEHGPAISGKFEITESWEYGHMFVLHGNTAYNDTEEVVAKQCLVDIVPTLRLNSWPDFLDEWRHRERIWPSSKMINDIVSKGSLLVCKPRDMQIEKYRHTDWRLSFSEAEVYLVSNRDAPCKQHAQRIFKYIIKYMTKTNPSGEERFINSYHCKTVLLWACEKVAPDQWSWKNLGMRVLGLLDDLITCITRRTCPHYFLPGINLFADINSKALDNVAVDLQGFRHTLDVQSQIVGKEPLLPRSEMSILSDHGIQPFYVEPEHDMHHFGFVGHKFKSYVSALEEDSIQLLRMSLKYEDGYAEADVAKIAAHMDKHLRLADENGGVYIADRLVLTDIIPLDELPKESTYHEQREYRKQAGMRFD